jgi:2-(1,2-epoxy-1,2-dihydrophenyl)acetyl-CoA isomerase
MTTDLLETIKDGVAVLTMNRPDRLNALSRPMLDAMLEALARLADDPAVGAVVLTGAGRGFCAGGDVKAMAEGNELGGTTMEEKAQALRGRMETSRLLHEMPKPTIAMVRGAAAGAGLSLALACDLRVAAESAVLVPAFAGIGLAPDAGSTHALARLLGPQRAFAWMISNRRLSAAEALERGLVDEVVPDEELARAAGALAAELAAGPTRAIGLTKRLFDRALETSLEDQLEREADAQALAIATGDFREGVAAFLEKRAPGFRGE